jgi:hypothetical protein
MTNAEAATNTQAAAVAAQGAQVAQEKAPSKRGASQKEGAHKGQKLAKAAKPKKEASKAPKRKRVAKPKGEKANKKAHVIAMLQRKGGVTLDEVRKATGWQPHTRLPPTRSAAAWSAPRFSGPGPQRQNAGRLAAQGA